MKKIIAITVLAAALGCKSDERTDNDKTKGSGDEQPASEGSVEGKAEAEAPPARRSQTDRLWAFAPEDAIFGIVVGDGAFSTSVDIAIEIKRVLGSVPRGGQLVAKMEKQMRAEAPFDFFDKEAYGKSGLALDKGAAFFVDKDEEAVAVIPVGDRAAFRKLSKGKTEKVDGREVDRLGDGYCVEDKGVFVCSDSLARVDKALAQKKGALAERLQTLPAELRGDMELVALLDQIPDAQRGLADLSPAITNVKTGVLSARMAGGRLAVRGWLEGTPPAPVAGGLEKLAFSPALRQVGGGAVSAVLLRVPLEATGLMAKLPPSMPLAGFDFRTGVVDQLTGEMAMYTAASDNPLGTTITLAVGMKDTAALADAMVKLCPMGNAAPGVSIKAEKGQCTAEIDPSQLPSPEVKALFPGKVPVTLTAKDQVLTMSIGGQPKKGSAADQAGSAAAKSMFTDKWNAVMWGRWADPLTGEGSLQAALGPLKGAPAETQMAIEVARVAFAHLFESGMAFRLDDKGAHLLAEFTTMAADPPAAYQAYSKAASDGIASGKPYADALAAAVAEHSGSLAAKQAELLKNAAPTLAFGIGVGAAIAIPAFTKYIERSKEASRRYEKMQEMQKAKGR